MRRLFQKSVKGLLLPALCKKQSMIKSIAILILCSIFLPAAALHIQYGTHIVMDRPVYENVYVAGGNVTINAPVHGDLVIAGGTVVINDTIFNDILLAGGSVTCQAFTGGDMRCMGGDIRISKNINGDLLAAGGQLLIDKDVQVNNLISSGGTITMHGTVLNDMRCWAGKIIFDGMIMHDLECHASNININGKVNGSAILAADDISIGPEASFQNGVRYWSRRDPVPFGKSLAQATAVFDPSLRMRNGEWYLLYKPGILSLLWYLGMAFVWVVLIQYLFSTTLKKAADTVYRRPMRSMAAGLLFFIATPVLIFVTVITLIGIPVGLLVTVCYFILLLLSVEISSVLLANWYNNRYAKNYTNLRLSLLAFLIFAALKLVTVTPFIGWLLTVLLVCMTFGSLLLNTPWQKNKLQQPSV